MTEPTPPTTSTPEPEKKPRGPRREATKVAAAILIASRHESPAMLLKLLANIATAPKTVSDEADKIHVQDKATRAWRVANIERRTFVEEVTGLPAEALVGVEAILRSLTPRKGATKDVAP